MKITTMINSEIIEKMMKNRKIRKEITKRSHMMFFSFYFAQYIKFEMAPFQKEMFSLTENESIKNIYIVSFRGSGKSTIITTSYPLWAMLGIQRKKFIVIIFQTMSQAKLGMSNIRDMLENNSLLKNDLGPFEEESDEWGSSSLVFKDLNSRIKVMSTEQSIRGLRHHEHRPDLIIMDDVQDLSSCKNQDARDKIYDWFKGEVIPAGDINTRIVMVGNLLHNDSLLMRIKREIHENKHEGVFKEYPILDEDNKCLWPGKFPTRESIQQLRQNTASEVAWQREYLLRIIPDEDQVINPEWIQYYKNLPDRKNPNNEYRYTVHSIDLAVSENDKADKTAIITMSVYGFGNNIRIYIHMNPINDKMTLPKTLEKIISLPKHKVFVEAVGMQIGMTQMLVKEGIQAIDVKVSADKRSRLSLISPAIQSGKILFAHRGNEEVVDQIVNFGSERYDDLVDALTLGANKILLENNNRPTPFPSANRHRKDNDDKPITSGLMEMIF